MKIVGIATQGRQDAAQWVTAYFIYYGYDGVYFSKVRYWWNYAVKVSQVYLRLMLSLKGTRCDKMCCVKNVPFGGDAIGTL